MRIALTQLPTVLPTSICWLRSVVRLPSTLRLPIGGFPSDFKSAYRQVTSDPNQALDFVIASWDADRQCEVFFMAVTQLFGSGKAPLNFTRYAELCCQALAALFAIPAIHCVDDDIVLET